MKKLTKKDLIEKLGRSEEEYKLYSKILKIFPEFWEHKVDGEKLCNSLEIRDNFSTWLLGETKYDKNGNLKSQGKLIKYKCVENEDFVSDWISPNAQFSQEEIKNMSPQKRSAHGIKNKIILTVECAKKIAMKQNNDMGDLVCEYFILMEKIVHDYELWLIQREPQKPINKNINILLDEKYKSIHNGERTHNFVYSCNADMVNLIAFGKMAKDINDFLEAKNDGKTRDRLVVDCLERLTFILEQNELLIKMKRDFYSRENMLIEMYKARYDNTQLNITNHTYKPVEYTRPSFWEEKYMI